jgi:hypothetical protein
MLGQHSVLVTPRRGLQLVSSKTIRIGDTKYDISQLVKKINLKKNG